MFVLYLHKYAQAIGNLPKFIQLILAILSIFYVLLHKYILFLYI